VERTSSGEWVEIFISRRGRIAVNCKYEDSIYAIKQDIKEIKKDIRTLLKFKWQAIGVGGALAFITSIGLTVFKLLF
jgi:hypothetical protein